MCGIAGICDWNGRNISSALLEGMVRAIHHRGPDASSLFLDDCAGLAHARLSIIDLGGGAQPMTNEDATLWITFNGEIFNYLELREELIQRGHRFATRSDTEVILHAYEEFGPDCVQRFNGQWAFGIWDMRRRELFLSRDRLGKRPVFYTNVGETFLFGSEIKALFAHPAVNRRIDLTGLDQVFTFWAPRAPRTIFAGINELPPAHSLLVRNGQVSTFRYWSLDYSPQDDVVESGDSARQLRELLTDATRIRLRSDVPIGAYLSGGLDSTVTTALVKQLAQDQLCTFSIGFTDPEFDESSFQQEVVRELGTKHESLQCTAEQIGAIFPDVIRHTENPVLRTAAAPLYLLSDLVRERGFKVVLTGEGADEVLGGYDIFKEAKIRRFWARQIESQQRPRLLERLYPYLPNLQAQSAAYRQAFFGVRPEDLNNPFFSHLPRWELTSRIKAFFSKSVKEELRQVNAIDELRGALATEYHRWHPFCQAQYLESSGLLPSYILSSQGDRVALAHAVEMRLPFLDYRVVEFASRLPVRDKMHGLTEKYLLKEAVRGLIPESVRTRTKQPYRAPDAQCFVGANSPDYVQELLSPDRITRDGIFDPDAVGRLAQKARQGQAIGTKDNMALVGILSTQLVLEQFINGNGSQPVPAGTAPPAVIDVRRHVALPERGVKLKVEV